MAHIAKQGNTFQLYDAKGLLIGTFKNKKDAERAALKEWDKEAKEREG